MQPLPVKNSGVDKQIIRQTKGLIYMKCYVKTNQLSRQVHILLFCNLYFFSRTIGML